MREVATLSHAWRSWTGAKGVALLAILAFAIGIGSATAIFTVINGVLLRPLPYDQSERFVALYGARFTEPGQFSSSSTADLREYQSATTSFDVFGWFRLGNFNLTSPGEPQYVAGAAVTPSLAQNLGVPPALGRWFNDESGAVISNSLWRRLGGSPDIVGTALTLDERQLTITGVMPPEFRLPIQGTTTGRLQSDVWIYLDPSGANQPEDSFYFAYARRKPGVSLQQAQADAARVAADIARREPATHPSYTATVVDLRRDTLSDLQETLLLLFAAAGLLLLIACANVATLLLARSVTRARETAVRLALGAGRGHLALKYLVEAAAVSLVGAAAGVGLSAALVRVVLVVGSEYLPDADDIAIDWKVVSFGLAMAFLASALASLAPLWHALRTPPNAVLTEGVRATAGASVRRLSQALVVAEIALAFTLLAVSTILVVHLGNLRRVPTGFNPDNVLAFELTAPARIVNSKTLMPFQKRLLEALEAVPGVTGAALVNQLPLDGCCVGGTVYPEGVPPGEDARRVAFLFVTPGYMTAMGIPLRAGRFLTDADTNDKELFAVVNQAAVNRYWPDRNPVGAFGRLNRPDGNRFQVVGVVSDIRNDGLNEAPEAEVYLLATMIPVNPMHIIVRSPLPTGQLLLEVRRALQSVERTLTIRNARAMTDVVSDSLQLERVSSVMMSGFALAALLMATLGIYGVVSYAVRQRTVEMGTRMALGAVSRDLFALVVGGGFRMAGLGLAVGVPALAASVWLLAQFMEIRDIGWVPFASSTVVVALIASVASYVPAWRASLLSPMVAIRDESASAWSARRRFLSSLRSAGGAVSMAAPAPAPPTLLTEFVAAARAADSFDEALAKALGTLCRSLGVDAAVLLEAAGGAHRARIAIGPFESIAWAVPADGFLASRLAAYPLPLPFDPGEFDALREWAAAHRPDRLEEIRLLASADVRMAVPLRTRTEIMGVLLMGASRDRAHFGPVEKQILANCADQFALMIENARLTDRVVGQEALRRDLALAAEVQRRLLPADAPSADIAEFAAVSLPARSIGGDYYDFIQVGEQRIGIALADVSGKGITAALIMSVVQASLRIIASDGDISLPRLAARMNDFLYRTTPGNKYATFFYARVDGDRRQLRYVNAGHNPPYLVRMRRPDAGESEADPPMEELTIGGAVVGMLPGMSYEEATVDLCQGDVLLAYTDGVTEAHNPDNVEFGEDRLKALLRGVAHLSAEEIRARIEQELKDWIKDAEQYDDLTFVVMKVH